MRLLIKITALLFFLPFMKAQGQNTDITVPGDSLSLQTIISKVISDYPSINRVESDIAGANARIDLAKSAYYPDINISSSYSRIGPTLSITIPGMGTFSLYPADNYSAVLNYNQTIYDFGKTAKSIDVEQQNKELIKLSAGQLKQRLSLTLVGNYYTIVFLQEAIRIKDEELATLNEHLSFVEKKVATGSATQYEILTTKVRISSIENQKTDLLTSLQVQLCQLNSFLGQSEKTQLTIKKEIGIPQMAAPVDSMISYAFAHRDELKIARQKSALAEARYKMVSAQTNPAFNFFASGGVKNGYLPNLNTPKGNYVVGVGLKIPIYDANRTKYNCLQIKADLQGNDQDIELARRNIVNEVVESHANVESSLKKVAQSELQLQQAQQAYALAETSFRSGVITNLDLLDSSTSVAESRLALLKTKIDFTVSQLKLKIVCGERLY